MSDDVVARLRKPCAARLIFDEHAPGHFRYADNFDDLQIEAADTITSLRTQLSAAEAQCAAMKEALKETKSSIRKMAEVVIADGPIDQLLQTIDAALSNLPARAQELLDKLAAAEAKLAACEELKRGYYNEAAEGWSKFRAAEGTIAAMVGALERCRNAAMTRYTQGAVKACTDVENIINEALSNLPAPLTTSQLRTSSHLRPR